jgi:monoamine oxidase
MFVLYEEPFWRAEGLNAQLISEVGPARMSNDSCMPDETGGPGIILAFLEGESARVAGRWPAAQRAEALRAELGRHFGPRATKPSLIVEGGWADGQWTRGCYNANSGPCGLIHFGEALSKPIGPIVGRDRAANAWGGTWARSRPDAAPHARPSPIFQLPAGDRQNDVASRLTSFLWAEYGPVRSLIWHPVSCA